MRFLRGDSERSGKGGGLPEKAAIEVGTGGADGWREGGTGGHIGPKALEEAINALLGFEDEVAGSAFVSAGRFPAGKEGVNGGRRGFRPGVGAASPRVKVASGR